MRASLFFGVALGLAVAGCAPRPTPGPSLAEPVAFVAPPPPAPQQIVVPPPGAMEQMSSPPRYRSAYRVKRHHHRAHRRYYGGSRPVTVKRVRVHGLHGPVYRDRTTAH